MLNKRISYSLNSRPRYIIFPCFCFTGEEEQMCPVSTFGKRARSHQMLKTRRCLSAGSPYGLTPQGGGGRIRGEVPRRLFIFYMCVFFLRCKLVFHLCQKSKCTSAAAASYFRNTRIRPRRRRIFVCLSQPHIIIYCAIHMMQ